MPDLSEFENLDELEYLRRQNRELLAKLNRKDRDQAALVEAVHRGARDAAVLLGNPPKVPKAAKDRRTKRAEVALLHLSDWQLGKRTKTYDSDVAARRVDALADKVVHLANIERADHPVNEIHVLWGGDIIEGVNIFPGQAYEIDSGLLEQVFAAVGAGERLLRVLLANFERVVCWQEEGNHGRLGRRGEMPREDNADLVVYALLKERMAAYADRIVWEPKQSFYSIVTIGAYQAILVHGDEIRSFGGQTPAFGIAKKVNAWATGVVPDFVDCYMGHWHDRHTIPLARGGSCVFVNPSLESDSLYAAEFVGASARPGQRLHFIDPDKGRVTTERIVWLDHIG